MANALVIFDGNGALPQKTTFQSPTDGRVVFVLSGTAWTSSAPAMLGIDVLLDGNILGKPALCFANDNSVHMAMRPTFIPFAGLTIGNHAIQLVPANGNTVTDVNDYYQVVMLF
jgi:hypothetical protein